MYFISLIIVIYSHSLTIRLKAGLIQPFWINYQDNRLIQIFSKKNFFIHFSDFRNLTINASTQLQQRNLPAFSIIIIIGQLKLKFSHTIFGVPKRDEKSDYEISRFIFLSLSFMKCVFCEIRFLHIFDRTLTSISYSLLRRQHEFVINK